MVCEKNIEPGSLKGKLMLNLDSEEDEALDAGCAGGKSESLRNATPREAWIVVAGQGRLRTTS
ncbi:MAG: hypothetical protein ACI97A_002010 [Planctomycetota bacterium]|jgi:hypothetical protein